MQIELNTEEAQVLVNLLDVAQKAAGLQASESCIHFVKKITEAQKAVNTSDIPEVPTDKDV